MPDEAIRRFTRFRDDGLGSPHRELGATQSLPHAPYSRLAIALR
jgi:hypothetical protein